jgi:hypothetical protein
VRASYLQIYNEVISDLLKPERTNLTIREDKKRGVFVEGLSEWVVRSPAEIYGTFCVFLHLFKYCKTLIMFCFSLSFSFFFCFFFVFFLFLFIMFDSAWWCRAL